MYKELKQIDLFKNYLYQLLPTLLKLLKIEKEVLIQNELSIVN